MAFADKKRKNEYDENFRQEHYTRIYLRLRKGHEQVVRSAASAAGESVNVYIKQAIADRLEADGFDVPEDF